MRALIRGIEKIQSKRENATGSNMNPTEIRASGLIPEEIDGSATRVRIIKGVTAYRAIWVNRSFRFCCDQPEP
jgi:hypothetical protein